MLTLLALSTLSAPAHAFCGTYVGQSGNDLVNRTSEVILAREGERTTLTLTNDYEGALNQFAMLIPVPVVLGEEDVRVMASWVPEELERYSGPRLVEYTCDDFHDHYSPRSLYGLGCTEYALAEDAAYASGDTSDTVNVEAEFEVGEYEIVILSAEESSGLLSWLDANGYAIDLDAEELLQEYIDSGSYFFAAKVDLTENFGETTLSPLQFSYESEVFSLPIRLGTVNSPGEQDLIVYALTDWQDGQLGIANYPERELSDNECMISPDKDFDTWYANAVSDALSGQEEAGWLFEYGWAPYHCDPCPDGEALSDALVQELGFTGGSWAAYFSRIRMRYTPEQATADLVLYNTGITDNEQVRIISYNENMEDRFPICDEGFVTDNPGDCEEEFKELTREERREHRSENREGCSSLERRESRFAGLVGVLCGLVAVRRRRLS